MVINHASSMPEEKIRVQLGLLEPLPETQEQLLHSRIVTAHGEEIPDLIIKGMVMAQRLRDATMAEGP